ncbi:MAG: putative bifunctional diguanylate cyclase/phosphodiesterase [Pyrinomonadaceae bacterium]
MEKKETVADLCLLALLPVGIAAVVWACLNFPSERLDWQLGILTIVTVFFSSYLQIQLPRAKIHMTTSDAMVILAMLWYGGEIAVLLTTLETAFTSTVLRAQGTRMRVKTAVVNVVVACVTVFATTGILRLLFGPVPDVLTSGDVTKYVWLLATMAASLFFCNSILLSVFVASRTGKRITTIWNEYCLNAFVLYLSGAVLAGITAKATQQINWLLFAAVAGFFGFVYLTYRRYIRDIKQTSALAEQAERERAEQAERHVKELEHYVMQLEESGEALRESHERLQHAAYHDALTGLSNRNYFIERIDSLLAERRDGNEAFALLFLDLNRFKTINDSLGHALGDQLIRDVAARLVAVAGERNEVGRFSGDEFAVLLTGANVSEAVALAESIADEIARPFELSGRQVYTNACIGIALGTAVYKCATDLLRDADIAMYCAKDNKRTYVIFDHDMHERAVRLLELETSLRDAVDRGEFEVHYQPIVGLRDGRVAGFEALVRWRQPDGSYIPPPDFIPICEASDLIVPLTRLILVESCRQVAEWNRSSVGEPLFISVNISSRHIDRAEIVEHVAAALEESRLHPSCLKLEITETAVMENAEAAIELLERIRRLGVQISIDDFGTGYSSLSYLHRFPIDTLKIDQSFVRSLGRREGDGEIVHTILTLARGLGLSVVAEGIETVEQLDRLRMMGCDLGQGYLFSRPGTADVIAEFLSACRANGDRITIERSSLDPARVDQLTLAG